MLYQTLKELNLRSLKSGDKVARSAYTLLLGEIARTCDPSAEVSDATVVSAAKKIITGINQMIDLGVNNPELNGQLTALEVLLPSAPSIQDIELFVDRFIANNAPLSIKEMGVVMNALKETFAGAYDGKVVSQMVREKLSK